MKVAAAVIVAVIISLLGWLFMGSLLYGVGYLASHARDGVGLPHLVHGLLMWTLGPAFGGFLATFVTPRVFKKVDGSTISTSFISVVVTLAIVVGLFSLFLTYQEKPSLGEFIAFIVQVSALVVGAKLGKTR